MPTTTIADSGAFEGVIMSRKPAEEKQEQHEQGSPAPDGGRRKRTRKPKGELMQAPVDTAATVPDLVPASLTGSPREASPLEMPPQTLKSGEFFLTAGEPLERRVREPVKPDSRPFGEHGDDHRDTPRSFALPAPAEPRPAANPAAPPERPPTLQPMLDAQKRSQNVAPLERLVAEEMVSSTTGATPIKTGEIPARVETDTSSFAFAGIPTPLPAVTLRDKVARFLRAPKDVLDAARNIAQIGKELETIRNIMNNLRLEHAGAIDVERKKLNAFAGKVDLLAEQVQALQAQGGNVKAAPPDQSAVDAAVAKAADAYLVKVQRQLDEFYAVWTAHQTALQADLQMVRTNQETIIPQWKSLLDDAHKVVTQAGSLRAELERAAIEASARMAEYRALSVQPKPFSESKPVPVPAPGAHVEVPVAAQVAPVPDLKLLPRQASDRELEDAFESTNPGDMPREIPTPPKVFKIPVVERPLPDMEDIRPSYKKPLALAVLAASLVGFMVFDYNSNIPELAWALVKKKAGVKDETGQAKKPEQKLVADAAEPPVVATLPQTTNGAEELGTPIRIGQPEREEEKSKKPATEKPKHAEAPAAKQPPEKPAPKPKASTKPRADAEETSFPAGMSTQDALRSMGLQVKNKPVERDSDGLPIDKPTVEVKPLKDPTPKRPVPKAPEINSAPEREKKCKVRGGVRVCVSE